MRQNFSQQSYLTTYFEAIPTVIDSIKRNKTFIFQFFSGQLLLQLFNILNGFFLLRWLSVEEQAKFSVAFSIQTFIVSLSDLGFTGSILALTGNRIHDKKLIGSYIASAKSLRNIFLVFSCVISIIILPFIIKKQAWSLTETILLLSPVIFSVLWQANCSLYNSTLVMHKKMTALYKPQVIIAFLKIIANYALSVASVIGAFSVLGLNAFSLFLTGRLFKKKADAYIDLSEKNYQPAKKEMMGYLKPLLPSMVFNAFFGQIQIFLISFLGKTSSVAEVAALGKLSQLFVFLGSVNAVIVSPMIAKSTSQDLKKKFFIVFVITFFIAFSIYLLSVINPGLFLFLLGPKYSHLQHELPIAIAGSCLAYLSGAVWAMNSARKWLFWWASILYIVSIIVCQAYGVVYFDLSQTSGVFYLSLLTAVVVLAVQLSISFVGFLKSRTDLQAN